MDAQSHSQKLVSDRRHALNSSLLTYDPPEPTLNTEAQTNQVVHRMNPREKEDSMIRGVFNLAAAVIGVSFLVVPRAQATKVIVDKPAVQPPPW